MTKEIETEHGSVVLDADWLDAVNYVWELVKADEKIKRFDKEIRPMVRSVAYEILEKAFLEYDFDDIVLKDDYFWEWFAEQQED